VKVICSAASFGYLIKCISATKAEESNGRMPTCRQTTARYVLSEASRDPTEEIKGKWDEAELQNPAHSLHTVGRQASAVGPQHKNAEVRGLMSEL
jgi:hypothetical protein